MAATLSDLENAISVAPPNLQPALNIVGQLFTKLSTNLDAHVADNLRDIKAVENRMLEAVARIVTIERQSVPTALQAITDRINTTEASIASSTGALHTLAGRIAQLEQNAAGGLPPGLPPAAPTAALTELNTKLQLFETELHNKLQVFEQQQQQAHQAHQQQAQILTATANALATGVTDKFTALDAATADLAARIAKIEATPAVTGLVDTVTGLITSAHNTSASIDEVQRRILALEASGTGLMSGAYNGARAGTGCGPGGPCLAKLKSARPADGAFAGARDNIVEFRKSVVSWASADYPGVDEILRWAEERTDEVTAAAVQGSGLDAQAAALNQQLRRELWSFLKPESEARDVIQHTGVHDGLEAWRILMRLCRPKSGYRQVLDVKAILSPGTCTTLEQFPQALARWETNIRDYITLVGQDPMHSVATKKVVAAGLLPPEHQKEIAKDMHKFTTWVEFRQELWEYVDRMKSPTSYTPARGKGPPADHGGAAPMQIGQVLSLIHI